MGLLFTYRAQLTLMQLCDSNFPTGAFSHSFGLETYIQQGVVKDSQTLKKWLEVYVGRQLCYNDGLAISLFYDGETVEELDQLLYVTSASKETREGTRMIGKRMLKLLNELKEVPELQQYQHHIETKKAMGHPALVYALFCQSLGLSKRECMVTYLYNTSSSLVQNAVRAIPLGQTEGQKLLFQFQQCLEDGVEKIESLGKDDLGINLPGVELAQMQHEDAHIRLFMS